MRRRIRRNVKVRRVVRRLELWSVFKVAAVCHACCYGVTLGVGALLWRAALRNGIIGNLEKFIREIGFADDFRLDGPALWRGVVFGGLALLVINVIGTVLLAFFYNMVAAILGGVVISMLEEAPASPPLGAVPYAVDGTRGARRRRRRAANAAKVVARAGGAAASAGGVMAGPDVDAPGVPAGSVVAAAASGARGARGAALRGPSGNERSGRRSGRRSGATANGSGPTGPSPDPTRSMLVDPTLIAETDERDWFESPIVDENSQPADRS